MHREHPAAYLEFIDTRLYTVVAMGLLAAGVVVCVLVENSRFGLALLAIRQNELAAEAAGINARQWKMRALITSGVIAAAAGGLYACVLLVVTPDSVFGLLVSAQPVVVTLFGGVASIWGPVIGAAVLVPLAELLNAQLGNVLPGIQGVVYGAAIIVIILAAPDGLFWTIRDRWFRRALPPPPLALPALPVPSRAYATAGGADHLLQVRNLSRSFGGLRAVSEVSFTVARGEILGIIGPNGAGKTTLFNLLNGVLPADEGSATLAGEPMLGHKVHQVCRMGVGRTFQVVRSFPRLPLLDNVIVGAYGAGLSDRDAMAAAELRIAPRRPVAVRDTPGRAAHQQAVAADGTRARARRSAAPVAARRDAGGPRARRVRRSARRVWHRLRDEGMTIAIIEHTMHAMMRIADRFVVLDHGAVLAIRSAPRRGRGPRGDRGLSRQEVPGATECVGSQPHLLSVLEVRNLSVAYGGLRALTDVSLSVAEGQLRHRGWPERRRQIDPVQNHLRHRPAATGRRSRSWARTCSPCRRPPARISASPMCPRGVRCSGP